MGVENGLKEVRQKVENQNSPESNEQLIANIKKIEDGITKAREARILGDKYSGISKELEEEFTKRLEEAYTTGLELSKTIKN